MHLGRAVAVAGVLVALGAATVEAQGPVWGKSWAGGADLPLPFGAGSGSPWIKPTGAGVPAERSIGAA